jgi:hypothetical protein
LPEKSEVSKTNTDFRPLTSDLSPHLFLTLGKAHDMARMKLNGKGLGVVWCAPWRVDISDALKAGDKQPADANAREMQAPPGFLRGQEVKTGRYTFSTHDPYKIESPLLPSGLLGPV